MNVAELKKRILLGFAYPELFYLPSEKKKKVSKLIIYPMIYATLNNTLDGFYDVPTYTSVPYIKSSVCFVIIDLSGNVVYRYDNNTTDTASNKIEIEISDGDYIVKILSMSGYASVNSDAEKVKVNGETSFDLKLYVRHFKAVTVNSYDVETFTTSTPFSHGPRVVDEPKEIMRLSQVDIYELKWNKWVKVLSHNCTPLRIDSYQVDSITTTTATYVVGFVKNKVTTSTIYGETPLIAETTTEIAHFASYMVRNNNLPSKVTQEFKFLDDTRYAAGLHGFQSSNSYLAPYREIDGVGSTDSCQQCMNRELYTTDYKGQILKRFGSLIESRAAINVYQEMQKGANVYDINDISAEKFFGSLGGSSLWKFKNYDPWNNVWVEDYRIIFTENLYILAVADTNAELIKTYLPTINYFDSDFKEERERDEAHSGNFWGWITTVGFSPFASSRAVLVEENGTIASYTYGLLSFHDLIITNINAMDSRSFTWYAEDYDKYI